MGGSSKQKKKPATSTKGIWSSAMIQWLRLRRALPRALLAHRFSGKFPHTQGRIGLSVPLRNDRGGLGSGGRGFNVKNGQHIRGIFYFSHSKSPIHAINPSNAMPTIEQSENRSRQPRRFRRQTKAGHIPLPQSDSKAAYCTQHNGIHHKTPTPVLCQSHQVSSPQAVQSSLEIIISRITPNGLCDLPFRHSRTLQTFRSFAHLFRLLASS
jgi:hypothetical protein